MVTLLIFLSFPALGVWAWIADSRKDKREWAKLEKQAREWLEEQNKLPKYRVKVLTKGGKEYFSDPFDPATDIHLYFRELYKFTSLEKARESIELDIRGKYFYYPKDNLYVPMCEVEEMKAEVYVSG